MEQAPVRPQRGQSAECQKLILKLKIVFAGLVPFGKETKEPFFSSTWDEFDQMRNQMMQKNGSFWDKVDQDMKVTE